MSSMMPEPWSIDDLSDEEYAAWETEQEAMWLEAPDREFWEEMWDMVADDLVIPNWDEEAYRDRLAAAIWRYERGRQLTHGDLSALVQAGKADLAGKATPRPKGRPVARMSVRQRRKRELMAAYLRDQGLALEVVAVKLGTGIEARDVPELVARVKGFTFTFMAPPGLDAELMAEILAEHKTR
ncbi:hypothetical protein Aeroheme_01434 [Aeromonas sp. DSM 116730]|uniref:hypothetical protein n=1 Tax=Aeromonas sp. DSM 116730 TaxID=3115851 RepID=UPI003981EE3F